MKLLRIILLSVLVPLVLSCGKEERTVSSVSDAGKEPFNIRPEIKLSTKSSSDTDVSEVAIDNLSLFILGVNSNGRTETTKDLLKATRIIDMLSFTGFTNEGNDTDGNTIFRSNSVARTGNVEEGIKYYFLAIANYPSDFSFPNDLDSLKNLVTNGYITNGHIMMASDELVLSDFTEANRNEESALSVSLSLSRICSKVDIKNDVFGRTFNVPAINFEGEPAVEGQDKIKVIGVSLANNYQIPTYVFPRSMGSSNDTPKFFDGSVAEHDNRFFAEPNTFAVNLKMAKSDFPVLDGFYVRNPDEKYIWTTAASGEELYTSLGYMRENNASYHGSDGTYRYYAPGIVIKAEYTPANLNKEDRTFYEYNGIYYRTNPAEGGGEDINPDLVHEYKNGICYYLGWIMTYSTDDMSLSDININEVGTVRNHEYKMSLGNITTIGSHLPSPLKYKYYDLNVNIISEEVVNNEIIFD